ncbi:putative pinin/SDK/memA/ protein conserved region [Monocercomonoides exilis]|uniref:putative pinin/SDK/memA/ protein conserved region n=1 Tax=Monocercomonoides exilis TaxID=2049356 RepID=UPI00355A31CE|nr:putative pinin/SDK/memA/ protein conserved region [Monocercomonoides exilis]|eukprot:MONOS_4208.1-p1 / transcript=MONOS_4208.1 / gene=MONOS_4208 / organism=Monocercomonoides_exilis_PA203 / gene_product=unspecified product / transcript_product=unspecified product / location=Mono_scaffold00109:8684-10090(+) / protein_length=370 / sequence_SO=supercontig / SO=protein_coding / is_pseudo=false
MLRSELSRISSSLRQLVRAVHDADAQIVKYRHEINTHENKLKEIRMLEENTSSLQDSKEILNEKQGDFEEKRMQLSSEESRETHRQKSERANAAATAPESEQKRGRNMFGFLLGHLQKAKSDQEKEREIEAKRKELERQAELKQMRQILEENNEHIGSLRHKISEIEELKAKWMERIDMYEKEEKKLQDMIKQEMRSQMKETVSEPHILYSPNRKTILQRIQKKTDEADDSSAGSSSLFEPSPLPTITSRDIEFELTWKQRQREEGKHLENKETKQSTLNKNEFNEANEKKGLEGEISHAYERKDGDSEDEGKEREVTESSTRKSVVEKRREEEREEAEDDMIEKKEDDEQSEDMVEERANENDDGNKDS